MRERLRAVVILASTACTDNTARRHSANDGLPPVTFERHMIEKRKASSALLRTAVA